MEQERIRISGLDKDLSLLAKELKFPMNTASEYQFIFIFTNL